MEVKIDDSLADWYLQGETALLLKPTPDGRIEVVKEELDDFTLSPTRAETLGFLTQEEIEKTFEELKKKVRW